MGGGEDTIPVVPRNDSYEDVNFNLLPGTKRHHPCTRICRPQYTNKTFPKTYVGVLPRMMRSHPLHGTLVKISYIPSPLLLLDGRPSSSEVCIVSPDRHQRRRKNNYDVQNTLSSNTSNIVGSNDVLRKMNFMPTNIALQGSSLALTLPFSTALQPPSARYLFSESCSRARRMRPHRQPHFPPASPSPPCHRLFPRRHQRLR